MPGLLFHSEDQAREGIMSDNSYLKIAEAGLRPSVQRTAIYEYLYEHPVHPTVDMIYTALSPEYPTLSKTTVYNTLKAFADHGLVQSIQIEEDKVRYDANIRPHLHFKCIRCGSVYDVFAPENSRGIQNAHSKCCTFLPEGFITQKIQTNIWGICASCSVVPADMEQPHAEN